MRTAACRRGLETSFTSQCQVWTPLHSMACPPSALEWVGGRHEDGKPTMGSEVRDTAWSNEYFAANVRALLLLC